MPGSHIGFMVGIDRVDALEGDIKPYLRPMSSMTEEERRTYDNLACDFNEISMSNSIDWLNENMFDFRSLIPMGLALEAEKGMYKTE